MLHYCGRIIAFFVQKRNTENRQQLNCKDGWKKTDRKMEAPESRQPESRQLPVLKKNDKISFYESNQ